MELEKTLEQYGLDKKEAAVYLASLQIGKETAFNIAKKCGLKRSTVYITLNKLNIMGLIDISKTVKAALYRPVSPGKLLQLIDFRKKQIEEILPILFALYKDRPEKPRIQVLEGYQGLTQIYQEATEYASKNKEILIFGQSKHLPIKFKKELDNWLRIMKNKKLKARELISLDDFTQEYVEKIKQNKNQNHLTKVVPVGTFTNDNIIYGNKIAIFSVEKDLFVTLIESKDIVQSYRGIFELGWHSGKVK